MTETELMHYGVVGMKWGVRRASKQLSKATTKEQFDAAVSKLNKHKSKASSKVEKLGKQRVKLQKDVDKRIQKDDGREAKLRQKSAKLKRRAMRRFTSDDKSQKIMLKAMKLDIKADKIKAYSDAAKNKLEKNKTKTRLFEDGIASIDKALIDKGRQALSSK